MAGSSGRSTATPISESCPRLRYREQGLPGFSGRLSRSSGPSDRPARRFASMLFFRANSEQATGMMAERMGRISNSGAPPAARGPSCPGAGSGPEAGGVSVADSGFREEQVEAKRDWRRSDSGLTYGREYKRRRRSGTRSRAESFPATSSRQSAGSDPRVEPHGAARPGRYSSARSRNSTGP